MRQKHANLIHAWAEGAQIQRLQRNGEWKDVLSPAFLPHFNYRIKPEPKPYIVKFVTVYKNGQPGITVWDSEETCRNSWLRASEVAGIIKYTISGETGELIKSEVLK